MQTRQPSTDDPDAKKDAELLIKARSLLEAVTQVQLQFIEDSEHRATFEQLLDILLDYSASEYGLIGEVLIDAEGKPYLSTLALTDISWDEATRSAYEQHKSGKLAFHKLNTLIGSVLTTGKPVIANDPGHDNRAGGLPHGHPGLRSFLGMPLHKGNELIGMLGIANRAGGYDEAFCEELMPLTASCAALIESWRSNVRRSRAEAALLLSNQRFSAVLQALPDLMFELDRNGGYLNVWGVREDLLVAPAEQLPGKTVTEVLPPAAAAEVLAAIAEADANDHSFGRQIRLTLPCGETWFELSVARQPAAGSDEASFIVLSRDITRRKRNEEALQLSASVYQASREGIMVTDENNCILDINPAFTRITGYTLDEVRGKKPSMFRSGKHEPSFYQQMWQSILSEGHWQGEIWDRRSDGELHAKWLTISVIRRPDGSLFRYVGQFSDITEKKLKDELIWTQANYDALTGLPNRSLLNDRLHQAMSSGMRSGRYGALISLDLDQFKRLNDTSGHSLGDKLLIEVSRRLQSCVREEDTVARMGGDEFVVVLCELSADQNEAAVHAEQVAEKIRARLCLPYLLGEAEYHTSSSAGIVLFRGHVDSKEDLLAHVEAAMYQAKSAGRNASCFFDASMQVALEKRSQLERALRTALSRREFTLYYQLQVDHCGHSIGAEALLRWANPQLGMVSPVQFIPVAEESGLILSIGHWVMETACAQLARWQDEPRMRHLCIAVNVSARQFREAGFVAQVRDALTKYRIRPGALKLELTESMVLDNVEDSIHKMKELKTLGVKFSMDDFGTGYSSLSYLIRLPIDQLKIDQSFVRDITVDTNDAIIVQTIISMAHSLGLDVIAEGVETPEQREFLEKHGCLAYQGYLYARPFPAGELEAKLANG